jgi:hypothetical protein
MWLAMSLKKKAEVSVLGRKVELAVSGMADGCVGCLLVFDTREAAAEYAGEGGQIVQIEVTKRPRRAVIGA